MADNKPSISIFFPFLNDWGTVGSLVGLAAATVSKLTSDWEILIVNDGSKREDREALELIVRSFGGIRGIRGMRRIRVIHHKENRGYGGALRSGFASAKKDLIFYTDCDAQYDPRELTKLYEKMVKPAFAKATAGEVGMVNGYKIKRNDPLVRIIVGRLYHYIVKLAFGLPLKDTDCDFRLIRREVFDKVQLFENTGTICVELVKKIDHAGYKIAEVPIHHFWRTSGQSQFFNFRRLFATGINLTKLWWKLMVKSEHNK